VPWCRGECERGLVICVWVGWVRGWLVVVIFDGEDTDCGTRGTIFDTLGGPQPKLLSMHRRWYNISVFGGVLMLVKFWAVNAQPAMRLCILVYELVWAWGAGLFRLPRGLHVCWCLASQPACAPSAEVPRQPECRSTATATRWLRLWLLCAELFTTAVGCERKSDLYI
jgi:hypothetical protein